jgi:hypothetical protein
MSQIGLKALKVLGGVESLTDNTAQLSEAWLNKIKKINQVAETFESNNSGVLKKKTIQNKKPQVQQKSSPILEQKEKQIPISEILARTKTEKLGIAKKQVSPDDIMALLSGNRPQAMPIVENKRIETQYQDFIKESKQYIKEENIIDEDNNSSQIMNQDVDIRKMVTEEVTRILFKEVFSKDRLKVMMESVFRDVIKEKAKEILFETLQRRKAQGN